MPVTTEVFLTRKAAAIYLTRIGCAITARTLERLAANGNAGNGPPYFRSGWRTLRYRQSDLDKWAKKRVEVVE